MTSQLSLETFDSPQIQNNLAVYSSRETVWKALKDWKFEVVESSKVMFSKDEYKAWISGQLSDMPAEKQEFLKTMFAVKFPGSSANPQILIHFRIRRLE